MDPFTMVVLIVFIVFGSRLYSNYLRDRRASHGVDDQLLAEIDQLRDRVAVLEEIVTDGKYQLKRELDQLER